MAKAMAKGTEGNKARQTAQGALSLKANESQIQSTALASPGSLPLSRSRTLRLTPPWQPDQAIGIDRSAVGFSYYLLLSFSAPGLN